MKLARAEEHFSQLRSEHGAFLERNPYRALREPDGDEDRYLWRLKIMEQPPLERWAGIAGDCVHCLRSALDHTAWELVRLTLDPPPTTTEFPIFKDECAFNNAYPAKLPGVAPEILAEVQSVQPYRGAQEDSPLWVLHQLDILDKHRRLHVVNAALDATGWRPTGCRITDLETYFGAFEDGAIVARFRMIPNDPDSEMHVYTEFAFDIAFDASEPTGEIGAFRSLETIRVYVAGVVACFDRFFRESQDSASPSKG